MLSRKDLQKVGLLTRSSFKIFEALLLSLKTDEKVFFSLFFYYLICPLNCYIRLQHKYFFTIIMNQAIKSDQLWRALHEHNATKPGTCHYWWRKYCARGSPREWSLWKSIQRIMAANNFDWKTCISCLYILRATFFFTFVLKNVVVPYLFISGVPIWIYFFHISDFQYIIESCIQNLL